jgi:hypothetical protein
VAAVAEWAQLDDSVATVAQALFLLGTKDNGTVIKHYN